MEAVTPRLQGMKLYFMGMEDTELHAAIAVKLMTWDCRRRTVKRQTLNKIKIDIERKRWRVHVNFSRTERLMIDG